jgi:hypothetical protein
MNLSKPKILAVLFTLSISSLPVFSNSDIEEDMESYMSECNAPSELYDPEAMANTLADPVKFLQLVEAIKNPATVNTLVECATHPEQMQTILQSLSDPAKYMNMMIIFMNPQTYMNWMAASTSPEFNQSEFEMINASEMAKTLETFYKLLTSLQANPKNNTSNHN